MAVAKDAKRLFKGRDIARDLRKIPRGFVNTFINPTIIYRDEFTDWLMWANAGMTDPGTLHCMDHVMRNLPSDAPVVEVGVFSGMGTNLLAYFRYRHPRANTIFCADKWIFEPHPVTSGGPDASTGGGGYLGGVPHLTHEEYREFVKGSFIRNVQTFCIGELPNAVEELSDDFFALWRKDATVTDVFGKECTLGGPIAFSVIDGDHTYDAARRDFENSDEFLVDGGFLFFDDTADLADYRWGVHDVVAEVKRSGRYEVVMKNPHYLFQKKRSLT